MAANTGKLAGKTIFITGASRGIGKAIALKCAKDGANIVIAAKTVTAHPTLPGTIYTAAKEVEDAGGKCLPCVVDIRSEEQVQKAVDETVKEFGGIDILVNNASAISLTGTIDTPMKRYDLMNSINARGTYLCSQICAPHLKKSQNAHILNISPPLNMNPLWFQNHVAYTMAKYGMSMCALGMADEFKPDGIAVNTLWPRTAIWTAAMAMLAGGEAAKAQCRSVDIMSDAAYAILTKDSRTATGNFYIDDAVLEESGVTDIDQYACVKGGVLLPDFFLDVDPHALKEQLEAQGGTAAFTGSKGAGGVSSDTTKTLGNIKGMLSEELCQSMNAVFVFDLKDEGVHYMDLKNGSGAVGSGEAPTKADVTMTLDGESFNNMFAGKMNPTSAFMTGKLKIAGDLGKAMKLEKLMGQMKAKL